MFTNLGIPNWVTGAPPCDVIRIASLQVYPQVIKRLVRCSQPTNLYDATGISQPYLMTRGYTLTMNTWITMLESQVMALKIHHNQ